MKYLRIDEKNWRRECLQTDKFSLASQIWEPFISNCQKAFNPDQNLTIDDQFLPCKVKCKFIQYMGNKPDKYGLKFWLLVDVEHKYSYNGFPYLGRDANRQATTSLSADVVLKLMNPLFGGGYNVICNNYFSSLKVSNSLMKNICSFIGKVRQNRRELPRKALVKQDVHDTKIFIETEKGTSLTACQCKKIKKNLLLHKDVKIPEANNLKHKPEAVLFYNKNKVAVDVIDQMTRMYSVKAASRRWPNHVFYNVIGLALINSWILYITVNNSSITRKQYIQKVCEELTGNIQNENVAPDSVDADAPAPKRRATCSTGRCNKNRTLDRCYCYNKTTLWQVCIEKMSQMLNSMHFFSYTFCTTCINIPRNFIF